MKQIDLGHGAIALEPDGDADRIDAVPRENFERFKLSEESMRIYEQYLASMRANKKEEYDPGPPNL